MKPIKQKNEYNCGPVALYNITVLLKLPPFELSFFENKLQTDNEGTCSDMMFSSLRSLTSFIGLVDYSKAPNYLREASIDGLDDGLILLGYYAGTEGHYTIIQKNKGQYLAYNCASDKVVENESHSKLKVKFRVTKEWLKSKLLDYDSEIYLVWRRKC